MANVHTHTGKETGHRFARCADCDWNVHGPDAESIDHDALRHTCPSGAVR